MKFQHKLRLLHVINHMATILFIMYASYTWVTFVGIWLWWWAIANVGISAGFHRFLAHNSFTTSTLHKIVMIFMGCIATGGTPLGWASVHRQHHAYTDTDQDPHCPSHLGFWNVYFHFWGNIQIKRKFVAPLMRDTIVIWFHRNYFWVLIGWATVLYIIGGLWLVAAMYSVPAVIGFHSYGITNTFCHMFGYRNFDTHDDSTNNILANILTGSEGWHNNHHANSKSWRIGIKWWEIDIAAMYIRMIKTNNPETPQ